jgi:hypothetical protein
MATIIENVRAKMAVMSSNPVAVGQNVAMAVAALREGVKSSAWEAYMSQFARKEDGSLDKEQLARLMGTDNTLGDPTLDRKRGYLIANAVCGMSTGFKIDYEVESIDNYIRGCECSMGGPTCERTPTNKPPYKRPGKKKTQ